MTLHDAIAMILCYFTKFGRSESQLCQRRGWNYTNTVHTKIV